MPEQIYSTLSPIRRRQQMQFLLRTLAYGLSVSSAAGVALGGWQMFGETPLSPALWVNVLLAGPAIGLLIGLARRIDWKVTASAVDEHYRLKDRAGTALDFLARPQKGALHELQVADAAEHLATVEARAVVPLRVPRSLPYALGLLAVAVALLSWPLDARRAQASLTEPLPGIVAVADQVRQDLLQLDELAKEEQNQELKDLVSKLKEMAEEMKEPGVDEREALAKLSEMQTEIAALQAQFNVGLVDGQLASLGAAMSASPALEGAGQALQEAKHDKAAEKLEELEDPEMTRKEAKAVEEKMKQVADAMGEAGLGQLSDAVSEMAEGLSDGKGGKFKKGTKKLAKEVRNQARRRRINRTLLAQLARLSDAKCDCQSNNLAKGKLPLKSLSPSNSFGMSTSGNVIGEKTELLAQRNQQDITGDPGEGPSEVETTHSPEGRQQAGRSYQQIYREYQKRSEAVLDSEPIPLGHRQTIRKYFELIRPQNLEAEPPTAEPATR